MQLACRPLEAPALKGHALTGTDDGDDGSYSVQCTPVPYTSASVQAGSLDIVAAAHCVSPGLQVTSISMCLPWHQ